MEGLNDLISMSDVLDFHTDKECKKKTIERFYYLYQPYIYLTDLPTEMGLKEGKYEFTDKDTMWFKSVKTTEQLSSILGKDGEKYVLIEARNIATSKLGVIKF